MIDIATPAGVMPAYVARPAGAGRHPAIILLQEIFGITDELRRIADRLAAEGYLVVLPALFYRTDPAFFARYDADGLARGRAARDAIAHEDLRADISAIIAWVRRQPDADGRLATWGFCWGGSVAFLTATFPEVGAAVSFYGAQTVKSPAPGQPPMLDYAPSIQAPLYFAFGGQDASIPGDDLDTLRDTMVANQKRFELRFYQSEGHAFFRFFGTPQQSPAAADVWPRVLAFLQNTLTERTDDQIDRQ